MKKKILIVEDEKNLMQVLEDTLLQEGFEVCKAFDGETAVDLFYEANPDLILLDINLPKKDGWSICKEIREQSTKPIIMMTARDTELDEVKGLSIGADDYITKPFSLKILVIKIKKNLKMENYQTYNHLGVNLNFSNARLFIDNEEVEISKKEMQFLEYFIKNSGIVLNRDTLLNEVWGYGFDGNDRVVDTLVKRLRKKLTPYNYLIKTIRGMGYLFDENQT